MSHLASLKHPKQAKNAWGWGLEGGGAGKKSREEKHDGAIGQQVLFSPERDQAKSGRGQSFTSPPSTNSQKEPIGKKHYENDKAHHKRRIIHSSLMVKHGLVN